MAVMIIFVEYSLHGLTTYVTKVFVKVTMLFLLCASNRVYIIIPTMNSIKSKLVARENLTWWNKITARLLGNFEVKETYSNKWHMLKMHLYRLLINMWHSIGYL